MKLDLHTHSTYSDGTCTPEEIVELASTIKLGGIALTDHNTLEGLVPFVHAGKKLGVVTIPGIELSTSWTHPVTGEINEIHVVGLNVPVEGSDEIYAVLKDYSARKVESNKILEERLKEIGIEVDLDNLIKTSPSGFVNRAVFGREMWKRGYVSSVKEAFEKYLRPELGLYVEPTRPDVKTAVQALKNSGATVVMAHPLFTFHSIEDVRLALDDIGGFDAMETEYSTYTDEDRRQLKELAAEKHLLWSGGSDFHGSSKPDIYIGKAKVDTDMPETVKVL